MRTKTLSWIKNRAITVKAYIKSYEMSDHPVIAEVLGDELAIHDDLYYAKEKTLTHIGSGMMIVSSASIDPLEGLPSFRLSSSQKIKRLRLLGEAIQEAIPSLTKSGQPNENELIIIASLIKKAKSGYLDTHKDKFGDSEAVSNQADPT
jgi:hypothetical protein